MCTESKVLLFDNTESFASDAFAGWWYAARSEIHHGGTETRRKVEKSEHCGNAFLTMIVVRTHHISAEGNPCQPIGRARESSGFLGFLRALSLIAISELTSSRGDRTAIELIPPPLRLWSRPLSIDAKELAESIGDFNAPD